MKTMKQEALEHWNRIACGSSTEILDGHSCPYCVKFTECIYCPIAKKTRRIQCRNTPFYKIHEAWRESHDGEIWQSECADAIEAMIKLIEYLPEE